MLVSGESVVITGGGSGMGAAAARMLTEKGAKVGLLGRRVDAIEAVARETGSTAVSCDISDAEALESAFDHLEQSMGTARILVHAAATGRMQPLLDGPGTASPRSIIKQIIDTNVLGTLFTNQVFAARLSRVKPLENGLRGLIINVSSIGALDGSVGSSYVASKAAVNGLGLSLARELSAFGIRVMTIAPGGVDTEMFRAGANAATHELVASSVPGLGRIGNPGEFAELVRHICENDYLNGSIIRLDGGMRIPFVTNVGVDTEHLE